MADLPADADMKNPGSAGPLMAIHLVCGLDEAGRGPLAGPVVAAAVVLPPEFPVELLDDSKKLRSYA